MRFSASSGLHSSAFVAALFATISGAAQAQFRFVDVPPESVPVLGAFIAEPVPASAFNDRYGPTRLNPQFSNKDFVRVSAFVFPSPDTDATPSTFGGPVFRTNNGAATSVSVSHTAFGNQQFNLTFAGATSGLGGFPNEYTKFFNRADPAVAAVLNDLGTSPFHLTVTNPQAFSPHPTSVTRDIQFNPNLLPPFVSNIALTGSGVSPTLSWTLPTNQNPNVYQEVNVLLEKFDVNPTTGATSNIKLVDFARLPRNSTSYTFGQLSNRTQGFPPDPLSIGEHYPGFPDTLEIGAHYQASVQVSFYFGYGSLAGVSNTFREFSPTTGSPISTVLPTSIVGPDYVYDILVQEGVPVIIDPVVAIGYDYKIGAGDPLFRSVKLPSIGDGVFELDLFNGTDYSFAALLNAGQEYVFAGLGVDRFRVRGIEASAGLDPANTAAFMTELTFAGDGRFTGTQTPLTLEVSAVPEPATYALMLAGLVVIFSGSRRRVFGVGTPTC